MAAPVAVAAEKGETAMKETIQIADYAQVIQEALPRGILLNTNAGKFNAMVIGWGSLGRIWSVPTFSVYVRENRFTREQLEKTEEFTISIPLEGIDSRINRVCGSQSGRDVDKVAEAGLTLEPARTTGTPGICQYPLTLECQVLYSQRQDISRLPEEIRNRMYPQDVDGTHPMANRDPHTEYVGRILDTYIIRP